LERTVKLNLGAGDERPDGYLNVDILPGDGVDIVADLNATPWAFDTESVDNIRAFHVFEHLVDKAVTLNECWRILRPGGVVEFEVPTTDGWGAWSDPQHVSYWNEDVLNYISASRNPVVYGYGKKSGLACNFGIERFDFFELRRNVFVMNVTMRKVAVL
jgi:SAM-dependent methyltransferase